MKRILAIILVLAMLPVSAFAESGWLTALEEKSIQLSGSTELYSGSYVNGHSDGMLSENYLVYEPGGSVEPLVCFGNDVAGAAGFSRIIEIEAEAGNVLQTGVNADFFTMATGVAMGLIIKNGRICSSARILYESIGFKADGSAIIGDPGLNVSVSDDTAGLAWQHLNFNKTLGKSNGLIVYSKDFGPDNGAGKHHSVIVRITEGECVPGGAVKGVVESVEACEGAKALEEGVLVLSIADDTDYKTILANLETINPGDEITVSFSMNEDWLDVVNAVGAERRLVAGGEIAEDILADTSDKTRAPRTAFGLRADGTAVVYTADGRDSSHSSGLLYIELAQRMLDLGCVEAVNLDGGASTQIYAEYPGTGAVTQVNQSSGGSVRRCADYLVFVNRAERTGEAVRLSIYPYSKRILAGSTLPLSVKASDSGWYAAEMPEGIPVWSVSGASGTIENSSFTAGSEAGVASVSVYAGNVSGSAEIEIITVPDELKVTYANGKALPAHLYVYAGESVSMKASVTYNRAELYSDEKAYKWVTEENLGSVENGVFTAAENVDTPVEGFVTVIAGEVARSIPVTVYKDDVPPVISGEVSGNLLMASVTDAYDPRFGKTNVSVRYDGKAMAFEMTEAGGVYANLPECDGNLHHIVIEAKDGQGHKSRLGIEVLQPAEGELTESVRIFEDLGDDDTFTPYGEYLSRRGIMAGKLRGELLYFDKDATLTRQEFAAVLCNWLRIDPYKYENDTLEFTDTESISPWATLFVKAVVSKGYMAGKGRNDGTVAFDPLGTITRQEVLTVLSKLLGEGYASEELKCSDADRISSWAVSFMQLAVTNGIENPGEGALRPLDAVTRGELGHMMISLD